ncbi:MAG: hypothetical protein IJP44_00080 [Bacteroidales bacterium]|nr:hypothetical protein [Bacteroidales bacterium]
MKTLSSNCFFSLLCDLLSVIYIVSHQPFLSIIPFFAKRYALYSGFGYKGSAYSSYSGGNLDALISAKVRRYFFAKANCFVGLGVQAGRYFSVENSSPTDVFFYCMPDIEIGYEYLLTDVHPALDNHLVLEVCASTLIPYKQRYWSTALPCFPALKLQVGISYHL